MKKLIASAASLTLAATILAGSASAASPLDFLKEFSWKNLFCQSQQAEQSQTEKALALINTFATGDTKTARSLLADGYIQHNLAYGTGADAFVGSVEYLASAPVKTTVQNIRAFEDGDKVFLQTIYNFAGAGEQVAFDIFRFDENGKIAEHWDNLAAVTEANPSGHTQTDGTMTITDLDKTEENRALVNSFLYDVMQGHNLDKMADYFDGDTYIQHNSYIADGVSGLTDALAALAQQNIQMIYTTTHQVLAEGNYVLAVSEGTYGGVPTAYYDLWRVENGKIAEHWDNLAAVAAANPSGHTQTDGTMTITDLDKTEENRALVNNFLYDVMQGHNLGKMADYFDGDTYIQHNSNIADGVSGLTDALAALAQQNIQMVYTTTHQVLADGNYVLAVSEGTYGGVPTAYYDLWRVENGKIAEHWDVMETIADQSTWQNQNGKF